jgi:hypothetical protein
MGCLANRYAAMLARIADAVSPFCSAIHAASMERAARAELAEDQLHRNARALEAWPAIMTAGSTEMRSCAMTPSAVFTINY